MLKIAYLTNAGRNSGVGRRAEAIADCLTGQVDLTRTRLGGKAGRLLMNGEVIKEIRPWKLKSLNWIRLGWRLPRDKKIDIWHATNQTLSFALPGLKKTVVTVHDLIELLEPQSRGSDLLARYLYSGIKRADKIIAVSNYTKQTIVDRLRVKEDKIKVVYNGVDAAFHEIDNFKITIGYKTLRQELKLDEKARVMLFVGSEHPRKNAGVAAQVLARLKTKFPELVLVKFGQPGLPAGRADLLDLVDKLKMRDRVRFVNESDQSRLNELYNLADVLIFPSKFEGFGLPVLEAFACGTPVVAANATAVPEVVGAAGLMNEPDDVDSFARDVERVLSDDKSREDLQAKGLARAQQFSWEKAAAQELAVYKELSN